MKTAKTFRLSDQAVAKLESQDNATQWLEELILGDSGKVSFKEMYESMVELFEYYTPRKEDEQKVPAEDLITGGERVIPPSPVEQEVLESLPVKLACCLAKTPCKHWIYNPLKQEYLNTLDGEIRSAE